MAEKRMFAKTIVLSDAFLDMPLSARCLYFTLGMMADDDGFINNPKSIMRQCGASEDDLKVLLAKSFVLSFESGVIVIKHWRINNYLRNDRYTSTKYVEEKSQLQITENGSYSLGIPSIGIHSLDKIREDKNSIDKYSEEEKRQDNNSHKAKNSKSELFDMISSFTENETLRKLLSSWLKERLQDSRMSKESFELNLSMLKQYGNGDEQKMIDKVSERLAAGHRALIYSNDLKEKNNVYKERQSQYSMAYDDTVTHDYSAKNNITRDENGEIVEIGF